MKSPTVTFKYSPTIKSKINNYRQAVSDGVTPTHCECNMVDDQYKVGEHVFTGNLNIIQNIELRTLMKKGLNYREIPTGNKSTVYKAVTDGLDLYIHKISERCKIPLDNFIPWKTEFLQKVKHKLDKLNSYRYNNVLSKQCNRNELQYLQNKWVFIPTDKAANNITIVCKKHYMEVLDQEIYTSGNFVKDNRNVNEILDNQIKVLHKFNLNTNKKMPFLYWIAKLHKEPHSHRFITSGRECAIQPLSIMVGYCLKTVLNIIRSNSKFHYKKSGVNNCFIIDNRYPVTEIIKKLNQRNEVHSVSTFDFQTLYTSIPHDKLKNVLSSVIKSAFNSRKKKFIKVTGKKATLVIDRKSCLNSPFSLSMSQLIDCVTFIIDQSYIVYKEESFRQCIGIPMGTNCAPYIANLFLYAYENIFIQKMIHEGHPEIALHLAYMYRYQDDCVVFNDDNTLLDRWREIYPVEMQLEKTNVGDSCSFLDLAISIDNGKFTYKSYDKRLDFNFEVINYSDLNSNVPRSPSYGVFNSQLVRFCDVNSQIGNFHSDIDTLVHKLMIQNFDLFTLKAKFKKFYANNIYRWSKFGSDIINLLV